MTELITALAVLFVSAGFFLLIANHFSLSPVPFYIVAGLVSGTFLEQPELIELAQWGIAFLVFVFGFRVDIASLKTVIRDSELAAVTQLLVVGPLAFGVALLFGFDPLNALYVAAAATLSSTLVGAGLLEHEIRDNLVHGRLSSSLHFFDDMVAIVLILVLSAEAFTATQITSKIGFGVLFVLAALAVYRHLFPLLGRLAGGSDELLMMASISILIGFIAAAELVGVSIVVGAFAAGIAIRSDEAATLGVRNGIDSIKDFFVAIFFVTVGALVTIPNLTSLLLALTIVFLVAVCNPLVLMGAFMYEGYDPRTAFLTSSSLNQVSELSLVIVIQAWLLESVAISTDVFHAIILAAAVTMVLTSVTREHEEAIYRTVIRRFVAGKQTRKIDDRSSVGECSDHVIIVGYGRQGRRLAKTCAELERPYVVIENDPVVWDLIERDCENYVLGDALSSYSWEVARAEEAALVVSTAAYRPVSEAVLTLGLGSETDIILRAETSEAARGLLEAGATYVSVPNVLAADQLGAILQLALETDSQTTIKTDHLELFDQLERSGFDSRLRPQRP